MISNASARGAIPFTSETETHPMLHTTTMFVMVDPNLNLYGAAATEEACRQAAIREWTDLVGRGTGEEVSENLESGWFVLAKVDVSAMDALAADRLLMAFRLVRK